MWNPNKIPSVKTTIWIRSHYKNFFIITYSLQNNENFYFLQFHQFFHRDTQYCKNPTALLTGLVNINNVLGFGLSIQKSNQKLVLVFKLYNLSHMFLILVISHTSL